MLLLHLLVIVLVVLRDLRRRRPLVVRMRPGQKLRIDVVRPLWEQRTLRAFHGCFMTVLCAAMDRNETVRMGVLICEIYVVDHGVRSS